MLGNITDLNFSLVIICSICLKEFLTVFYKWLTSKHFQVWKTIPSLFLECICIFCAYLVVINNIKLVNQFYTTEYVFDYYRYMQFCSIIIVMVVFIKIFQTMIVFKSVGFYIIIFNRITIRIIYFLTLFISVMFIFGTIFYLFFSGLSPTEEYLTWISSIKTVMMMSLGQIEFYVEKPEKDDYTNKQLMHNMEAVLVFLTAFLLMIILLNIMIAVLSNIYQEV